jgi:hypothetical protein
MEIKMNRRFIGMVISVFMVGLLPLAAQTAAPANDDFGGATIVQSAPFGTTEDTSGATVAADDPFCAGRSATVWFSFTPSQSTVIQANTFGSNYDTTLSVWTGNRGALNLVACNDDSQGLQSNVSFSANAGTTYFFMVSAFSLGPGGSLVFNISQLSSTSNDDFNNATAITAIPFTTTEDTTNTTVAADDPFCAGRSATVWFSFTPTTDLRVEANTFGSNYDTTLSVWTGSRGALNLVACNDDSQGLQSRVFFNATAGVTYFFMVSAFGSSAGGHLTLNVLQAPPALAISLDVAQFGSVDPTTGVATIHGTVSCNRPTFINLSGQLKRKLGTEVISGLFFALVSCNGTGSWTATIVSPPSLSHGRSNPLLVPGKSDVAASASAIDPDTADFAQAHITTSVVLRGSN